MITILLVEDNAVVRQTLSEVISMEDDFQVIGLAENGLFALELLSAGLKPDIVLADLNMPGMDGIELTGRMNSAYTEAKVIILTMHAKSTYLSRAIASGARGYLLKSGDLDELKTAMRKVNSGEIFIGDDIGHEPF